MQSRLNYRQAAPGLFQAMLDLDTLANKESGLDPRLVHLIKLRASHINGCAYCIDMHTKEARRHGLGEQWIALISTWHESPVYTPEERAVLGWTDALTRLADTGAPHAAYQPLLDHFSEEEIATITVAIGLINVWNRVAVGFRTQHPVDAAAHRAA